MDTADVMRLVIATLGGAAVGLEREWSGHAVGPQARFAGIRTFTLIGGLGGICGWLWTEGVTVPSAILLAGMALIVAAAYALRTSHDVEATTEVAAIVVLAAGLLAGIGSVRIASAIFALTTLLLVEKTRLHTFVSHIDDVGLRSGVRFGVMALVILPLLPEGPFGPLGGIRPQELWTLVLFFSGLSFAGYVARHVAGAERGYLVTGLVGGLMSSTNVTYTFARASRTERTNEYELALGTVAANAMLFPRVVFATAVLNPSVFAPLVVLLAAPAVVAALVAVSGLRRSQKPADTPTVEANNPLQLGVALQMAAVFQVVQMIVYAVGQFWGSSGVLTSAAIVGLTDVDALTISMTRSAAETLAPAVAAMAIAIGIVSNTVMKLVLALVLGTPRFRLVAGGALALMLAVLAAAILALG